MKAVISWQKEVHNWPHRLSELKIDPYKTALLIIDMQKASDLPLKVLPNNIKLLHFFRQQRLKILYCLVGAFLPDGRDRYMKFRLTYHRTSAQDPQDILPKGSLAYEVREELKPMPEEAAFDKNSGSAFNSSAIEHYLHAMEIQNLVICGIATSRCVENTARDAADRGYNVILVEDACGDRVPENHQATMHTFSRVFGTVKSTSEVISDLSRFISTELAVY